MKRLRTSQHSRATQTTETLRKHEHLFDGTLEDWDATPVHVENGTYSVPHAHSAT